MYAAIRRYTGDIGLAEKLIARRQDIESLMISAPGFISHSVMKTSEGAITVTVCEDQTGAERSNQIAADWMKQNMAHVLKKAPETHSGAVVLTLSAQAAGLPI